MEHILVTIPVTPTEKTMFKAAAPKEKIVYCEAENLTDELLEEATIILGNVPVARLEKATQLKWLQLNSSGFAEYVRRKDLLRHALLTSATGAYGLAISEHMIAMVLALLKKLHLYWQHMPLHLWQDEGSVSAIFGAKTLVVGLGNIGGDFACRMHALGSSVTAIRRNLSEKPDFIDAIYPLDALDRLLPQMDIVALCLPDTPETSRLFDRNRFDRMKKGAIFINVGRGAAVDTAALRDALNSGRLGGAGLDVTDPEPLTLQDPLWDAKNIMITPHVSGGFHLQETYRRVVRIMASNLDAFLQGRPLQNVVDLTTGYRNSSGA